LKINPKKRWIITIAIVLCFILLNPTFSDFKSYLGISRVNNFRSYSSEPRDPREPSERPDPREPLVPRERSMRNYYSRSTSSSKVANCILFSIYKNGDVTYLGIFKNFVRLN